MISSHHNHRPAASRQLIQRRGAAEKRASAASEKLNEATVNYSIQEGLYGRRAEEFSAAARQIDAWDVPFATIAA